VVRKLGLQVIPCGKITRGCATRKLYLKGRESVKSKGRELVLSGFLTLGSLGPWKVRGSISVYYVSRVRRKFFSEKRGVERGGQPLRERLRILTSLGGEGADFTAQSSISEEEANASGKSLAV